MEQTTFLPETQLPSQVLMSSKLLTRIRNIWLGLIILLFFIFLYNILGTYRMMMTVCDGETVVCYSWSQPNAEAVEFLTKHHIPLKTAVIYHLTLYVIVSVIFWTSGLLVLRYRSNDWHGLLVSYLLITLGAGGVSFVFLSGQAFTDLPSILNVISTVTIFPMYLALSLFFLTFPDGRIYPRWTSIGILLILANYAAWIAPEPYNIQFWHPYIGTIWISFVYGSHVAIQAYRYRYYYTREQRQQTKWLLYGFTFVFTIYIFTMPIDRALPQGFLDGTSVVFLYLPISIAVTVAILRYRLWDIDIIINRTLVYGILTGFVIATYILIVGSLGSLFDINGALSTSIVATTFVAIGFQPVRGRVQQTVNHLTFGDRDEPYKVISRLSRRLEHIIEPDAVLPTIIETVAQALKFPYAAIAIRRGEAYVVVTEYGKFQNDALIQLPLIYVNQVLGELRLAPRSPREPLTPKDKVLLDDLARQTGLAVHAVLLHIDLQLSRQQIVTEREEARRRLGSDLHDGIGHRLAALVRRIDLAARQAEEGNAVMDAMLEDLKAQLKATIDDVRSLAHRLHPPELELLGLSEALQECVRQYYDVLHITIDIPTYLPRMPLSVEVAAYYIIQEALANVSRHANATTCSLRLFVIENHTRTLVVNIQDDGVGFSSHRHTTGLGLASMTKRANELGGSFHIEAAPTGGTYIDVRLPCL